MNKIVITFLLTGDKLMPKMHLRQLGFTYSACGPFIKTKEKSEKKKRKKETVVSRYIYQNKLDKV